MPVGWVEKQDADFTSTRVFVTQTVSLRAVDNATCQPNRRSQTNSLRYMFLRYL